MSLLVRPIPALLLGLALTIGAAGCGGETDPPAPTGGATSAGPGGGTASAGGPAVAVLPAVQRYVDAVNRRDLDALVAAFAPDGRIVDVSRTIAGRDAIARWAEREVIGGTLRVDGVTALEAGRQRVRVHWAPGGSSGWAADYTFTVVGDAITVADLQYA